MLSVCAKQKSKFVEWERTWEQRKVKKSGRRTHNSGQHAKSVIYKYVNSGVFDFDNKRCSRIAEALSRLSNSQGGGVAVRSIEAIKGLEDTKCLFILTTDLTPYLLGDNKQDNRTKHLLYVALTRSLDELSVLVTKEVEDKYGRERIKKALT